MQPLELEQKQSLWSRFSLSYMEPLFHAAISKSKRKQQFTGRDLPQLSRAYRTDTASESYPLIAESKYVIPGLIRAIGLPVYLLVLLDIVNTVRFACEPIFMRSLIISFDAAEPDIAEGMKLAGFLICWRVFSVILNALLMQVTDVLSFRARALVFSAVIEKVPRLPSSQLESMGTGGFLALVLGADCISCFFYSMDDLWSCPVRFILSLAQLVGEAGWQCLLAVVISSISVYVNYVMSKRVSDGWEQYDLKYDEFSKSVHDNLHGIKAIKINCWEDYMAKKIYKGHAAILGLRRRVELVNNLNEGQKLLFGQLIVISAVLLSCWKEGTLTASKAYILLTLFERLNYPLFEFAELYNTYVNTRLQISRMRKVLDLPEKAPAVSTLVKGKIQLTDLSVQCMEKSEETKDIASAPVPRMRTVLSGINISIETGELLGISGPVACGKSLLLRSIIGESSVNRGTARFGGKVAFLPHEPWIFNDTLRTNIVASERFVGERYEKVIELCQLKEDLGLLKQGDMTLIGSRGVNLSGGQRQRVALARAIYSDADIYLMDDSLSQLDPQVARTVFSEAIVGFLAAKTRVFATSNPLWLSQLPRIVLIENGKLACDGDYQKVYSKAPQIFSSPHIFEANNKPKVKNISSNESETEPEAVDSTPKLTWEHMKQIFFSGNRMLLVAFVATFLASNFVGELRERWLFCWSYDSYHASTGFYLSAYVAIVIFCAAACLVPSQLRYPYVLDSTAALHDKMTAQVLRSAITWHYENETGAISTKLGTTFHQARYSIGNLADFFQNVCFFLLYLYQIVVRIPEYLLGVVAMILAFKFLHCLHQTLVEHTCSLWGSLSEERSARTEEFIEGMRVVRTPGGGLQDWVKARIYQKNDEALSSSVTTVLADKWVLLRYSVLNALVYSVVLIICTTKLGQVPAAVVAICLNYMSAIQQRFDMVALDLSDLQVSTISAIRVLDFIFGSPMENQSGKLLPKSSWPLRGSIEARNLSLRYRPSLPPILSHAEFHIAPGEKVGLVGRTGSGKSTLLLGLLRLLEPSMPDTETSTTLRVDGEDISKVSLSTLRSSVVMIPQEPWVFAGTVRDNIDPMGRCKDEHMLRELESLGLTELLQKKLGNPKESILEVALQTEGSNLSQGEKQLLCIARALVQRPRILLLDEATANLDEESERRVKRIISEGLKETTVLMIAHRQSSLGVCGRLLRVDDGKCVESVAN